MKSREQQRGLLSGDRRAAVPRAFGASKQNPSAAITSGNAITINNNNVAIDYNDADISA